MASRSFQENKRGEGERIPFYRNVKLIGVIAQVVFVLLLIAAGYILYNNVTTALDRSNLPADFGFLDARAGVPIAETPIQYEPSDSYGRALIVGVLNTLRVALVGVVLTTLLGILVGVMRLSSNWLMRQIATVYIEAIRNTPLAVQLVFWFTAVLVPIPPRISNPVDLPGGIYFSQVGLALPWLYPSYSFSSWLPWLVAALVVLAAFYLFRRRQIERSERPGNAWLWPLLSAAGIAVVGYVVVTFTTGLPENLATDFQANRGRGVVFADSNDNGLRDAGEPVVPYAVARVNVEEGTLTTNTQNFVESRSFVNSTFRFPAIENIEVGEAELSFTNPEQAEGLAIHTLNYPSTGVVYEDRNGNGEYDEGEEVGAEGAGFGNVGVTLQVEEFSRRIVADRGGQIRIPIFEGAQAEGEGGEESASSSQGGGGGLGSLFNRSSGGSSNAVDASVELQAAAPLVLSFPSVPRGNYVGGISLSAAYLALLIGLVVYTASFIAEIVRGGIQAVPKGQREAAKAVGLSNFQTFRLVVFPQALRIILPPMISQYLNLTKNSSLAILVTFQDFFSISNIVANQTGAAIPVILIVIGGYLIISLTFAFILNIVNERMALVER